MQACYQWTNRRSTKKAEEHWRLDMKFTTFDDFRSAGHASSTLRLNTIVRLRWLAVVGQVLAIGAVSLVMKFALPIGLCLALIAASAWLNVFLSIRYPARYKLSVRLATALLGYDILQLAGLLYLTGGIENPFTMLIVAPVTVSAATLPPRNTLMLGLAAVFATVLITIDAWPLPWFAGQTLEQPLFYRLGVLAAVIISMLFIALYAWRMANESRQMSAALAATEMVLAREQKLHALDGLAAAAAHELGTPLSTIALVAAELQRQVPNDNPVLLEDAQLLRSQALRCREILQKLTRQPAEQDPLHSSMAVRELFDEAAAPYHNARVPIVVAARTSEPEGSPAALEPKGTRQPGVIYGLGNFIENAIDFAETRVDLLAEWNAATVVLTISDDGQGFKPEIIDNLGEPYVTSRPAQSRKKYGKISGLGLGFFIAKTLLERSGARVELQNKPHPGHGAIVRVTWPRSVFSTQSSEQLPAPQIEDKEQLQVFAPDLR